MYRFESFAEAYDFLTKWGGYESETYLHQRDNEPNEVYISRIFQMANRIKECLERYPKDIEKYFIIHPEKRTHTYKELCFLTYKELSSIRASLGIKKKKTSAKKVLSSESDDRLSEKALSTINQMNTNQLVTSIILDNASEERKSDEAILTEEEIAFMYGEDMPSVSELIAKGYIPEYPDQYTKNLTRNKNFA